MKTRLLGISGSLRAASSSRAALQCALAKAEHLGAQVDLVDLRLTPLPLFNPDTRDGKHHALIAEKVRWANAYLIASPDYHGSMSGGVKNFLDYFWKELGGKLYGTILSSHEKGLTPTDHIRTAIRQCYGWSLPYGIAITEGDFDPHTKAPKNPKAAARLDMLVHDLTSYAPLLAAQFEKDLGKTGFAAHYEKPT